MVFDKELATQIVSYLLWKGKGCIPYLKLLKLVYLADRKALLELGDTLTGDSYSAMKLGPVPYFTYNNLKQDQFSQDWLVHKKYDVKLIKEVNGDDPLETFDLLSPVAQRILDSVWDEYGSFEKYKLAELTHSICPEWASCRTDSIQLADILKAENIPSEKIHKILQHIADSNKLQSLSRELQ